MPFRTLAGSFLKAFWRWFLRPSEVQNGVKQVPNGSPEASGRPLESFERFGDRFGVRFGVPKSLQNVLKFKFKSRVAVNGGFWGPEAGSIVSENVQNQL